MPGEDSRMSTAKATAIIVGVAALAGFAAVYVTLGRPDNASPPAAKPSPSQAAPQPAPSGPGTNALSRGEMAAFVFRKEAEPLPAFKFQDADGKERTLADWKGKVVLLNLWATWCLPCRKEMPALDRLQAAEGSAKFEVLAISVDRKGLDASKKFLDETGVKNLGLYVDTSGRLNSDLKAIGLPATILIDTEGREIGRLLGPAEWDSEDAVRLIRFATK